MIEAEAGVQAEDEVLESVANGEDREISAADLKALLEVEKRQRAQEAEQRRQAEDRLRRAEQERDEERTGRQSDVQARYESEMQAVQAAIAANTAEADRLEREAETAFSGGDYASGLKAQRQMARLEAQTEQSRLREKWLKDNKDTLTAPRQQAQPTRPAGVDLSKYSASQRAWIARNPLYVEQGAEADRFRNRVTSLHYAAVADGIAVDSTDYFRFMDEGLKSQQRRAAERDDDADPEPPRRRQQAEPPVMPVQRRAAAGSGDGSSKFKLSAEEMEAADAMMPDVPVQDWKDNSGQVQFGRYRRYANNRDSLRRQGRMG